LQVASPRHRHRQRGLRADAAKSASAMAVLPLAGPPASLPRPAGIRRRGAAHRFQRPHAMEPSCRAASPDALYLLAQPRDDMTPAPADMPLAASRREQSARSGRNPSSPVDTDVDIPYAHTSEHGSSAGLRHSEQGG
jgi:hypothetical protein